MLLEIDLLTLSLADEKIVPAPFNENHNVNLRVLKPSKTKIRYSSKLWILIHSIKFNEYWIFPIAVLTLTEKVH